MRRFILIAAILLTSASARADGPRSLSLAANGETQAAAQPGATEAPKAETAKVETKTDVKAETKIEAKDEAPKAVSAVNDAASPPSKPTSGKAEKLRVRREATEARVINELHRHGIYW